MEPIPTVTVSLQLLANCAIHPPDKMRRRSDVSTTTMNEASAVPKNVANNDESRSTSEQKKYIISRFYTIHIALVAAVLVLGMMHNVGNKKYIPINAKELHKLLMQTQISNSIEDDPDMWKKQCKKAYINVHSTSIDEELAAICCKDDDTTIHDQSANLCHPKLPITGTSTQQIPFAKRLTRLTEAWVLPLLPILIRLAYQVACAILAYYKRYFNNSSNQSSNRTSMQRVATSISYSPTSLEKIVIDTSSPSSTEVVTTMAASSHTYIRTTLKRLFFYFLLLNFRGWGLYIGANALEDFVFLPWFTGNTVTSPLRTDSLSDVEHDIHYEGDNQPPCWYEDVLKSHHKLSMEIHSECYGRPFDFSDHVVLFLAHYLPVFVMEILFFYQYPFSSRGSWYTIHVFLFLYLHLLVLHATYQTAVYFHTKGEIIVGYLVSLFVQLPVCYLMCSDKCIRLKEVIGIQEEAASSVEEKSD